MKTKVLCSELSSKRAKWVKDSRISTKGLSWKLLLTQKLDKERRAHTVSVCIPYLCRFTKFTLAFWWFLCLFCRWGGKKSSFLPSLNLFRFGQNLVEPAGLVYRNGRAFHLQTVWTAVVSMCAAGPALCCPTRTAWKCCRLKSFTQMPSQSFALPFRKQSHRRRKRHQETPKHVYLREEVFAG